MGVGEGVPLNELHCPTCGEQITDFFLRVENAEEEFSVDQMVSDIKQVAWQRYLLCPNLHKWSVIMVWSSRYRPDRVQLGRYLGSADV